MRAKNKYGNRKIECNGMKFDSLKEYRRWGALRLLEEEGEILNLRRQVKFVLIPAQRIDGKVVERECSYYADFVYTDRITNQTICEDVKGVRTKDYIIKRKLMLQKYGIRIKEI